MFRLEYADVVLTYKIGSLMQVFQLFRVQQIMLPTEMFLSVVVVVVYLTTLSASQTMGVAEGFNEINWKAFGRKRSFSNGGNCDNPGLSVCPE